MLDKWLTIGKNLKIPALAALMGLVLAVQGCYFPILFDAEIEIDRTGYYKITFDGYLADLGLYKGLRSKEIGPAEEEEKVARIITDLTRDSSTLEAKYFKKGRFKVHWEKSGDLLRDKMITFFRRNEKLLTLKYVSTNNMITMEGASIGKSAAKQLTEIGLGGLQGKIRVITDAKVISDNANKKKKGKKSREMIYSWKINGLYGPMPRLVIAIR